MRESQGVGVIEANEYAYLKIMSVPTISQYIRRVMTLLMTNKKPLYLGSTRVIGDLIEKSTFQEAEARFKVDCRKKCEEIETVRRDNSREGERQSGS